MKFNINDKVVCVIDCESIAQRFNSVRKGEQSRKIKKGEIFTIYGISDITPIILSLGDNEVRLLARAENFITLEHCRKDQIDKLL